MHDLKNLFLSEVENICRQLGLAKFKSREIFRFIHQKLKTNLAELTILTKEERERFSRNFFVSKLLPVKTEKTDRVIKAVFQLDEKKPIETVYMNYGHHRKTVCVSSQVGCPVGCRFCATGAMGFYRNLTAAEILEQIYFFARKTSISNIVFMGMGEPFLNYNNVMKAISILNSKDGLNQAARKIVISTIGIIPSIRMFAEESKQYRLAWSLVFPFDDLRQSLIPFKGLPTVKRTIRALQDYQEKTKRRITIEFPVLQNINDDDRSAKALAEIAEQLDCHINLIPFNAVSNSIFHAGNVLSVRQKIAMLNPKINVTIRASLGQEISAACGQLAGLLK